MVLSKHEKKYREFLKARKRLDEVEEELKKLPIRPLKVPYQRGWEVSIRLRDDIARRDDAADIYKLIDLGYEKGYITQSLKDVKAIRRGETEVEFIDYRGRKAMRCLFPSKKIIKEEVFKELPQSMQKYLDFDNLDPAYLKWGIKRYKVYLPSYWLKLKVRPHIVTHQYVKGGSLEKEAYHLRNLLREYWREWTGGKHYWKEDRWKDDRPEVRNAIQKFVKGESEDILV